MILILGSGLSGCAVYDYLIGCGVECKIASDGFINSKAGYGFDYDEYLKGVNLVVVSPGINLNKNAIQEIKLRKIEIIGELEFGSQKIDNDIIAVTGTNGKTTVVNLIHFVLGNSSVGSVLCGNVGVPITSIVNKIKNEIAVVECSSFQLEAIKNFRPHIAVILNITEDHLNRHIEMGEYVSCKYNITKNQSYEDYLILNADDEIIMKRKPNTRASVYYFSIYKKVKGCYIKRNCIYFCCDGKEEKLLSLKGLNLRGDHNLSNVLAAVLCVYLQTKNIDILKRAVNFKGVEHRIEFVKNINGIKFFNDSKATNVDSCLVACRSFGENIHLILGGYDKGVVFDLLFEKMPKNVKNIAIIGENRSKIALSAKRNNFNNYRLFNTLEDAVRGLFEDAKKGEIVLLSPASASFDQFLNFEQRGEVFKKIVESLC